MIEEDTIKLLQECNSGIKMGVSSIEEVLPHTQSNELRQTLMDCKKEHDRLGNMTHDMLNQYGDRGKDPHPVAKGMSYIMTNAKLAIKDDDKTIADLMTDGCNMGAKSLNRYLNEYEAAEEKAKDIAKKLIKLEEDMTDKIRSYL